MATIIPSPAHGQTSLEAGLAGVRATLTKVRLTPEQIELTLDELRPILEPLFWPKGFVLKLSESLKLSPDQIAGI